MTDSTATTAITPEGIGAPIETINDAIDEDARLAAVIEVATERRKELKAWTGATLGRAGAKAEHPDGAGTALITDPSTKPHVTDEEAFLAWALVNYPDRTGTRQTVQTGPIERALAGAEGDDLAKRLAEVLDEIPDAVTTEVITEEKLPADLAKPKVSRELADGRLVDKETGEIIPGLELRQASQPSPQIKPDKGLVATLADTIRGRLTPVPALETEEPADG